MQGHGGNAQASECDGGGIGQQGEPRGLERPEAQADENGAAYGHRGAEARCALKKRPKREGDQEQLQAAIVGDVGEAFLEGDEMSRLHGEVVEEDNGQNNPADGEDTVSRAVCSGGERQPDRHVKDSHGNRQRGEQAGEGCHMSLEAQNRHGAEQHHDGQGGNHGGEPPMAHGIVALRPLAASRIGPEQIDQCEDEGNDGCGKPCQRRRGCRLVSPRGSWAMLGRRMRFHGTS